MLMAFSSQQLGEVLFATQSIKYAKTLRYCTAFISSRPITCYCCRPVYYILRCSRLPRVKRRPLSPFEVNKASLATSVSTQRRSSTNMVWRRGEGRRGLQKAYFCIYLRMFFRIPGCYLYYQARCAEAPEAYPERHSNYANTKI